MNRTGKEIIEFLAKIFWGIIAIALFLFASYEICCREYLAAVILMITAILWNPFVLDRVFEKIGSRPNYYYMFTILYGSTGFIIAFRLCLNFGNDYQNVLKILMYIIYLIFLFMTKDWNKVAKYKIFGWIYGVSIVLGYMSDAMINRLINLLNVVHLTDRTIDINVWRLLTDDVLNPIKEAILTYIVIDTILEKSKVDKRDNDDKGKETMNGEKRKESECVENHIIINDKKITFENITTNIKIQTNDICISIKKNRL